MAGNSDQMSNSGEKQLIEAVQITLNPNVDPQMRKNAFEYIERFKQESPLCVEVGLRLLRKDNSPIIRHFGLQLVEHFIKFKWDTMENLRQESLKCTCLELIANGTKPVLEEPLHIKESLARLVVELIKREWPQKWETLLQDLTMICNMGDTQTELTLMVFLRLAEDIISMDSHLHQHRKREITQALHLHMEELFTFFIETLRTNTTNMIELKKNPSDSVPHPQAVVHQRVAEQTLLTLQGFLDWVKSDVLFIQDCIIPQMLCLLLNEVDLRIPACECLLMFVSRKGKLDLKQQCIRLFSQDAMQLMYTVTREACEAEYDESHYLFMKRLCQVLTTLGSVQLIEMWNKGRPKSKPETFQQYLETLLIFSRHKSLALTFLTNTLWLVILRSDIMVVDMDVKAVMPHLLELAKTKISRVGDMDSSDNEFNRGDFDSNKECDAVFTKVRSQAMEMIKIITLQFPAETFLQAADWLLQIVDKTKEGIQSVNAEQLKQLYTQWDGVCCYMTAVMGRLQTKDVLNHKLLIRDKSVTLLDLARNCICCLVVLDSSCTCNDPTILTNAIDILQSLLSFLTHAEDLILVVLKKIFSLVTYNTTGKPEGPWSLGVLQTRRRACSALLKMCQEYGSLLVPMFDEFKQYVKSLFEGELVTIPDRTMLTEALVIASNLVGRSQQNDFITSLLSPHKEFLIDNRNSISVEWLVGFLQMDKEPSEDQVVQNRSKLILALTTILALVRRCCPPKLTESNTSNSEQCSNDGDSAYRPCSSHVLPFLPSLLIVTQAVNNLYGPAAKASMFPAYIASLDMHDTEKCAIFALQNNVDGERTVEENKVVTTTKRYIYHLTDTCYIILGHAGNAIGAALYSQPGLGDFINEHIISTVRHLPNYRLRIVIRQFIKPFIVNCPTEYYNTTLVPVLSTFFTYMLQHLEDEWQSVKSRQSTSTAAQRCQHQQDTYSKEVIDDQFVHLVTKDYIDIFYLACTFKTKIVTQIEEQAEAMKSEDDQEMDSTKKKEDVTETNLGPLGENLIQSASVNMQLLTTAFASMTWLDTTACCKASKLTIPFIKKAVTMAQSLGSSIAAHVIDTLYSQILIGFQIHGESAQHMLLRVGCVLYELLGKQYPSLKQVVLQATGCPPSELQAFEDMLFGAKPRSEKSKRDQYKKLVENIFGKNLGELFKDEIKIKDLPAIKFPKRTKGISHDDENLGLAELFDPKKSTELI